MSKKTLNLKGRTAVSDKTSTVAYNIYIQQSRDWVNESLTWVGSNKPTNLDWSHCIWKLWLMLDITLWSPLVYWEGQNVMFLDCFVVYLYRIKYFSKQFFQRVSSDIIEMSTYISTGLDYLLFW